MKKMCVKMAPFCLLTLLSVAFFTCDVHASGYNRKQGLSFGVCEHHLDDVKAGLIKQLGVQWVRADVFWGSVQTTPDTYDWSRLDRINNLSKKYGFSFLPIIDYSAPWASTAPAEIMLSSDQSRYMPRMDEYQSFLNVLLSRYADIHVWEIWNEPNIPGFWKSSKADYARLLKDSYKQIKETRPHAMVLMGGLSEAPTDWIDMLHENDAINSFDAYNIHPYHYQVIPEKKLVKTLDRFVNHVAKIMSKPIWITEIGAPTNEVSLENQARYLVRDAVISFSHGVENFFWYQLVDRGSNPNEKEDNFGLLFKDLSPKPAYTAYATLIRSIGGAKFVRKLDLGSESAYGYSFSAPDRDVFVVWSTKDNEPRDIKINSAHATLRNIMGADSAISSIDGSFKLTLTQDPVYLISQRDKI